MLQLKNIIKTYKTGELTQDALKDVSITFRENEFVSVLGQSGSGKTTLLNIIGGLDRYTEGDLLINGVSTKQYRDVDWDFYRNNSIGFVFQSYNLIPHQTVLSNVELALTLSGISKKERRKRAKEVLNKVGLAEHIHKRPNQMSGGQMQRVAIARALVNNPDILLADEPTGALDSETSLQIMELLKEIANEKLVIMVTHNPELAEKYSTRIVKLLDGKIISDSNEFTEQVEVKPIPKKRKKISMSFFTALSLSFNNLRTKKGRTVLTSFAGSIGIIGIALILALSTGMNTYIANIQKDTMTSYPITIASETIDMSSSFGMQGELVGKNTQNSTDRNGVYADFTMLKAEDMMNSSVVENNLTAFKKYLEDENSEIHKYIGENGITYTYDVGFNVYSHDKNGDLVRSDAEVKDENANSDMDAMRNQMYKNMTSAMLGGATSGANNFSQLISAKSGEGISEIVTDNYDLLYGKYPEKYNEVVLVLDETNGISAESLYQLGLITEKRFENIREDIHDGKTPKEVNIDYKKVLRHKFKLVASCDMYEKKDNGTYALIEDTKLNEEKLLENAITLKISGIIKPKPDTDNASILTAVAYTDKLTAHLIKHTDNSKIIKAQQKNKTKNVLTGMKFEVKSKTAKVKEAKEYLSTLSVSEKNSFYQMMMYFASSEQENSDQPQVQMGGMMSAPMDENGIAKMFDMWLDSDPDEEFLIMVYDEYIKGYTYEENMKNFGKVSYDAPANISIYTDSFENKDAISECIENYNKTVSEDDEITYTDYIAIMTSSITTIINGISYVLIAFVAISLIVSCIMIGIITHISVMERTKEIGILRSLGASKRNISQVFNAETFIIGCLSGIIGIGVSLLLMIPINKIIQTITGIADLGAVLPLKYSAVLIIISIIVTIIGGLLPAKKAAKKDPVIALRTE